MNQLIRSAVLTFVLAVVLAGCAGKSPADGTDETAAAAPAPAPAPAAEPQAAAPAAPPPEAAAVDPAGPRPAIPEAAPAAPVAQPKAEPPAAPPAVTPATATEPAPAETPVSTAPVAAAPPEPATAEPKTRVAKDVIVLTGSPLGGVRFEHKLHAARAGSDCSRCHHASRPEKAASAPQQACRECHSKVATPPMKTIYQGAFHDPMAQSGTCIDCHKAENAKAKKAPLTCMECHKQENR